MGEVRHVLQPPVEVVVENLISSTLYSGFRVESEKTCQPSEFSRRLLPSPPPSSDTTLPALETPSSSPETAPDLDAFPSPCPPPLLLPLPSKSALRPPPLPPTSSAIVRLFFLFLSLSFCLVLEKNTKCNCSETFRGEGGKKTDFFAKDFIFIYYFV